MISEANFVNSKTSGQMDSTIGSMKEGVSVPSLAFLFPLLRDPKI